MTALKMLTGLKSNRDHILWINHDRRESAYHGFNDPHSAADKVDYNDAMMVRSDPEITIVAMRDGEILAAR